jgi:ABC-2 type transport system permease protein
MNNILAITHKELKSYFASPIAYVVIGLYDLVYGYYYYAAVRFFERQSIQMAGLGAGTPAVNINEQLIRPVFQYSMVVFLIILPMITMRTYSEEKRSGTMELLLTSPITDFQIIMGKFLGAMGLYAAMLGVTLIHMVLLFWVSQPEWMPILTSYLGMLLMGGCFMAVGLLISSLTKNQIVAVVATFAVFMMFWMINWIAQFMGPTSQAVLNYLSITTHLEDFMGGVIDTKHVVYYLSFIAFGLFLTARSVDVERWRG